MELTFSGIEPVVINRNGNIDNIYENIKTSSCDVTLVTPTILTDLYTTKKDDIIVQIEELVYEYENDTKTLESTNPLWEGYVTPNTFSQSLTQNLDNVSITCIDPVSLLKYVTLDKVFTRPNVYTYGQIIGQILDYVKLDSNTLYLENIVDYGEDEKILLDIQCQVSNFWDEGDNPMSCYDTLMEMLKPFGLCLSFSGNEYYIYDMVKSGENHVRHFTMCRITPVGLIIPVGGHDIIKYIEFLEFGRDWKPNNDTDTQISIGSTYDQITGDASTCVPNFSTMAIDKVNPEDRDQYDYQWFNVSLDRVNERNWKFIWNGVWVDDEYELETKYQTSGWSNIDNAYGWVNGVSLHNDEKGSILNFYGSGTNPIAEGRTQEIERPVEIKTCITAYAEENGIEPEFMEKNDLKWAWTYNPHVYTSEGEITEETMSHIGTRSIYGKSIDEQTPRIVYSQTYPNMTLVKEADQTLSFSLTQSYSRTGFRDPITVEQTAVCENVHWVTEWDPGLEDYSTYASSATVFQCPWPWNAENAKFEYNWFSRLMSYNHEMELVWDRRRVYMYVEKSDHTFLQFNGKDWVDVGYPNFDNTFTLKKIMNKQKMFHTDYQYDLIECADGDTYSLSDESYYYRVRTRKISGKNYTLFVGEGSEGAGDTKGPFKPYADVSTGLREYVSSSDKGKIDIILPRIDTTNVSVNVVVWSSNLLGMTGMKSHGDCSDFACSFIATDPVTHRTISGTGGNTGTVYGDGYNFLPVNCSYFKAEHLDLELSVTVPESNLGQMFSTSDIRYRVDLNKNYLEKYEGPTFKVNTYHPLVSSSYSYLIYNDQTADGEKFVINRNSVRPEVYVVNAYLNYLSKIRRKYQKTILPLNGSRVGNIMTYITAPEVTDVSIISEGTKLIVVTDSWDVQTDRHSIEAVESYGLDVEEVKSGKVQEIPRNARNSIYNNVSARKS